MNTRLRYIELLGEIVQNSIYGGDSTISDLDVDICRFLSEDLARRNSPALEKYPHLKDPLKFAEMISYTKRSRNIHTYVNAKGVANVIACCMSAMDDDIPGAFMEVGTLRGGIGILMNGIVQAYESDRTVIIADSFSGLPTPSENDSLFDREVWHYYSAQLKDYMFDCKCSLAEVQANFAKYKLDTANVLFLEGWVNETLQNFNCGISVLRLDVDWYEATAVSLEMLYPSVAQGGYIIIDDYNLKGCRHAVDNFRSKYQVSDSIAIVDEVSGIAFWRKT